MAPFMTHPDQMIFLETISSISDYYRVLGLPPTATFEELKAAHIQLGKPAPYNVIITV